MHLKLFPLLFSAFLGTVLSVSPAEKCTDNGWTVIDEASGKPICIKAFITDSDLTYNEAATMCIREGAQPSPMQNDEQKKAIKVAVENELSKNTKLKGGRYQIYLGAYHTAYPSGTHGRFYWLWDRTEVIGYTNWDNGQPDIEAYNKNQHEDCLMFPWSSTSGGTARWHDVACNCKKENKCITKTGGIVCAKFANEIRKAPVAPREIVPDLITTTTETPTSYDEDDEVIGCFSIDGLNESKNREETDAFAVTFHCDEIAMCIEARHEAVKLIDRIGKELPNEWYDVKNKFIEDHLYRAHLNYECTSNNAPEPHSNSIEPSQKIGRIAIALSWFGQYKYVTNFERLGSKYRITVLVTGHDKLMIWAISHFYITYTADFEVVEMTFTLKIYDCDFVALGGDN